MHRRRIVLLACSSALTAATLGAQQPAPVPNERAEQPETRADSIAERAALEAAVRRDPRDAAAWHRKGMIAWGLATSRRSAHYMPPEIIGYTRDADSSLGIAVQQRPDSIAWALDLSRYLLTSHLASERHMSWVVDRRTIAAAERRGDPAMLAAVLDAAGMGAWRNYEIYEKYEIPGGMQGVTKEMLERAEYDPATRAEVTKRATGDDASQFAGETDYRVAERYFADAVAADPSSRAALRHLYMAYAERERWEPLRQAARDRVERAPSDAVSWLVLGLATHRAGDDDLATAAFDRGFALLSPAERERLTRVSRLLPPRHMPGSPAVGPDSVTYAKATPAERAAITRRYWTDVDPIALTGVNEHRLEFYSRVIFSELMWSVDEFFIRGSETDRADLLVRYGWPVVQTKPSPDSLTWIYPWRSFTFGTPRGYGQAFNMAADTAGADWQSAVSAINWQDTPAARPDSGRAFVARFRAAGDSAGLYVASSLGVGRLASGVRRGSASVDVGFRLTDADARRVLGDSTRLHVAAEDTSAADVRAWQATVPAGDYRWRAEAVGVASRRSARAAGDVVAARGAGFGLSDLLLAASVQPLPGVAAPRWTDFVTAPDAGVVRRGDPLALLWETYDLAPGDSGARYRVTVTVEPAKRRDAVSAFAARVLSTAAGAFGQRADVSGGHLVVTYDRTVAARAAVPDYLTLDLAGAAAGAYVVHVAVEDLKTHATASAAAHFEVQP